MTHDLPKPFDPPTVPSTRTEPVLADTLSRIVTCNRVMGALYDEIAQVARERDAHNAVLFASLAGDLIDRGQKTKRVRDGERVYVVEVGYTPVVICACHGALLGECAAARDVTDAGEVSVQTVLARAPRPYVSVRELTAATNPSELAEVA